MQEAFGGEMMPRMYAHDPTDYGYWAFKGKRYKPQTPEDKLRVEALARELAIERGMSGAEFDRRKAHREARVKAEWNHSPIPQPTRTP